jgi:FG-GAP-like repeat
MFRLRNNSHRARALAPWRCWRIPFLIFTLVVANVGLAATGRLATPPPLPPRSLEHIGWAVADFDGDSRPDMAITKMQAQGSGYVYWLELDLSTSRADGSAQQPPAVPFVASSMFGLHLTPRDVDGDQDLDIVVTIGFARQPVAVWINDGQGGFEEGDLAAYPTLTDREELSFAPQSHPEIARVLYDQSRRSWFGLTLSGLLQPLVPSGRGPVPQPRSPLSLVPAHRLSARAPPSVLSLIF